MSLRIGFLSTYPPTACGLATFSRSLVAELTARNDVAVDVVSVVDAVGPSAPAEVVHQLVRGQRGSAARAAAVLNGSDAVLLQHEYGIYGGRDGADVLDVVRRLRAPVISVLHTVLARPSDHQRTVLARLASGSAAVVTMTRTARDRMVRLWGVPPDRVHVIPHGAAPNPPQPGDRLPGAAATILTWGLLGPGKGIEWAIDALAGLRDLAPPPVYRVVGQTHPQVLRRDGESYREGLKARARGRGVDAMVRFDARYLDGPALRAVVRSADVVLLPYDSREQVTSGVLVEAVVAGRPVVATAFPHAMELLADGAGLVVPQRDPVALQSALRCVLADPARAAAMAASAAALAPGLHWRAASSSSRASPTGTPPASCWLRRTCPSPWPRRTPAGGSATGAGPTADGGSRRAPGTTGDGPAGRWVSRPAPCPARTGPAPPRPPVGHSGSAACIAGPAPTRRSAPPSWSRHWVPTPPPVPCCATCSARPGCPGRIPSGRGRNHASPTPTPSCRRR